MPIKPAVRLDETIAFLNEALKLDPDAVKALCDTRVPCNKAMANHSSIQVGGATVGLIGLLNGLFGARDDLPKNHRFYMWGAISACYDLECPQHGHEVLKDAGNVNFGDPCPVCKKGLVLGRINKFEILNP